MQHTIPNTEPGTISLDDLFAEALAESEARSALKASKARLSDTRVKGSERKALEASVQTLELKLEWHAQANVAQFTTQHCDCGSKHSVFQGWFQRQRHKNGTAERWAQLQSELTLALPLERKDLIAKTAFCTDCVDGILAQYKAKLDSQTSQL